VKVLIADDETPARERLRRLLAEIGPPWQLVGEAVDGADALALCRAQPIDVALLDIRMPRLDGLECAAALQDLPTPPAVIFVTAFDEHALAAFDAHAVDYLLKPIRRDRLETALQRAKILTRAQLSALAEARPERDYLVATYRGGVRRIPVEDVLYLRAEQKYVVARHAGGEALLEDSLRTLEERLGDRFVRIHRNALVAREALIGLDKDAAGTCHARLKGIPDRLEVSRRHLPEIRALVREGP
jgi:two-component system response regulator AlgR